MRSTKKIMALVLALAIAISCATIVTVNIKANQNIDCTGKSQGIIAEFSPVNVGGTWDASKPRVAGPDGKSLIIDNNCGNSQQLYADNLDAGVYKVAYYFTVSSLNSSEFGGDRRLRLKPGIREDIYLNLSYETLLNNYVGQKVMVVAVVKTSASGLEVGFWPGPGFHGSMDKIVIADKDYDFGFDPYYYLIRESAADDGNEAYKPASNEWTASTKPELFYSFDDGTAKNIANPGTYDGTVLNGVSFENGLNGSKAASFTGAVGTTTDSRINITGPINSGLFSSTNQNVTINMVFKPSNVSTGIDKPILCGGNTGNDYMVFMTTRGDVSSRMAIKAGGGSEKSFAAPRSSFNPTTEEWHMITYVQVGNTAKIYLDGKEISSSSDIYRLDQINFNNVLALGASTQWPDPGYAGLVDSFAIYNKDLTAGNVAAMYNSLNLESTTVDISDEIIRYNFQGANALSDKSGNGADGTVINESLLNITDGTLSFNNSGKTGNTGGAVQIPESAFADMGNQTTISAYVKGGNLKETIFSIGNADANWMVLVNGWDSDGGTGPRVALKYDDAGDERWFNTQLGNCPTNYRDDWYLLTLAVYGNNARMYINETLVASFHNLKGDLKSIITASPVIELGRPTKWLDDAAFTGQMKHFIMFDHALNQAEVSAVYNKVTTNGYDGDIVIPPSVDKTNLNAAITTAEALYAAAVEGYEIGNYIQGSKATFLAAINAAKAVADNDQATQSQVNAAVTALNNAKTTFEAAVRTVDKTELADLITELEALYTGLDVGTGPKQYSQEFKDYLKGVLDNAKAVLNDNAASEEDVEYAVHDVSSEILWLPIGTNEFMDIFSQISDVAAKIEDYLENADESKYAAGALTRLEDAYLEAVQAYMDALFADELNIDLLKAVLEDLQKALDEFEASLITVDIDKTDLNAAISEAEALYKAAVEGTAKGQYKAGSKAKLKAAIDAAKAVAANEEATQEDIDAALDALLAAIDEFEDSRVNSDPKTGDMQSQIAIALVGLSGVGTVAILRKKRLAK